MKERRREEATVHRWIGWVALMAGVLASASAESRTLLILGAGFGSTGQESGPPGSLGVTVGVLRPLPHRQDAVGLEVTYQMLGLTARECEQFESVTPITVQLYEPVSIMPRQMAYLTIGGGVYVRHWGVPRGCDFIGYAVPGDSFREVTAESATAGGFNIGVGAKSRAPRGQTSFGIDLRYHGMYPRSYTSLWTAGVRLFF